MKLIYNEFVDVYLGKTDIKRLLNKEELFEKTYREDNDTNLSVRVIPIEKQFKCYGSVGESYDNDTYSGWRLLSPEELFSPTTEEILQGQMPRKDYHNLRIEISLPELEEVLKNGEDKVGICRGIASGNIIDRLNLYILPDH